MAWVKLFVVLRDRGLLNQHLSRKLVHTTTAPVFLLHWPLFSDNPGISCLVALVPFINLLRIVAVGSGAVRDDEFVRSLSRSGKRTELLRGPTSYCVAVVTATAVFWRDNPAGLLAISMLCGGDGLADIVGRTYGSAKLPHNRAKSWAGSFAMMLGGGSMAYAFVALFHFLGVLAGYSAASLAPVIAVVAVAATVVESLPIHHWADDNLSVPLVSAALGMALLPLAAGGPSCKAPAGVL